MENKVLLILADGMRPDGIKQSAHPFFSEITDHSKFSMNMLTVMPSVTLPCHMSLFHSVDTGRHGILTNTYVPQVRPVRGLCEVIYGAGMKCGMFYDWEELRDLSRPGTVAESSFISGHFYGYEKADELNTDNAIKFIADDNPDFTFLYLGFPDGAGHDIGWMSEHYIYSVKHSWDCIEKIVKTLSENYTVLITADHGGHDRCHGSDMPEDMTIPFVIYNKKYTREEMNKSISIIDIAPTITKILGIKDDTDWDGKSIL